MIDCFISYAREDLDAVRALYLTLRRLGLRVWMDKPPPPFDLDGLAPGERWDERIREVIEDAEYMVVCFSRASVAKPGYIQTEFRKALEKLSQLPHGQIFVIPIRLDDCAIPRTRVDGVSFDQYNYLDCFDANFDILVRFFADRLDTLRPDITQAQVQSRRPDGAGQLIDALGSHTRLSVRGTYNLSTLGPRARQNMRVEDVHDGTQIVFHDLADLTITGDPDDPAVIEVTPRYANVLEFHRCTNLRLANLVLRHAEDPGYCTGGVISLVDCHEVYIDACDLSGSGTYGLMLTRCSKVFVTGGSIHDCTYGALAFNDATSVEITGCRIHHNGGFSLLSGSRIDARLDAVVVEHNRFAGLGEALFQLRQSTVRVTNATIRDNVAGGLGDPAQLSLHATPLTGNSWQG